MADLWTIRMTAQFHVVSGMNDTRYNAVPHSEPPLQQLLGLISAKNVRITA